MKKTVGIVCGGYSGEAVISMGSAKMLLDNIDRDLFHPVQIVINKDRWYAISAEGEAEINKNDFSFAFQDEKVIPDICLIIIHGTPGEDGKLQGYFDLIGMPYSTGGVTNTSLTFNKILTTTMLSKFGFNTAKSLLLYKRDELDIDATVHDLGLPCFVKPNEGGSSLGASKVNTRAELEPAVKQAFDNGSSVIVESYLKGREVSCSAVRTPSGVITFELTEIVTQKEFFDYAAKYDYDQTQEITPAQVPVEISDKCKEITKEAYVKMNCKGIIRIDFKFDGKDLSIIEINTVPGMTEKSIVPQQAAAAGVSKTELVSMILGHFPERFS